MITGVLPYEDGQIHFEGSPVTLSSPLAARKLGIETVYQDLAIAPHLDSVANIFMGRDTESPGYLARWDSSITRRCARIRCSN